MSFEATAKNIISESIKSAVFIDDAIPELNDEQFATNPYCVPLYKAFQSSQCSLDFHKFTQIESIDNKLLFERKDLIILDWELDSIDPMFKSTLEIIDRAVETDNLHFVCIYSNQGSSYEDIFIKILAYYSGNIKEETEKTLMG
ncbi:MAG: response regulator receiver domain [Bacteroidales bacterium]